MPGLPLADAAVQHEIEQFLYFEAELLDERRYAEWIELFGVDARYWAPTHANRLRRDRGTELSVQGEVALFDFDRTTLGWRVRQMQASMHWAEDPPSRTRHLVSNVRITPLEDGNGDTGFAVRSNFICYRNRLADEVDIWAGERQDELRRGGAARWTIGNRTIILDQNVVLSKNLSVLF